MDAIITYLNFDIDIVFYIEISIGYKIDGKIYFLKKIIYKLRQSAY